MIKRRHLGLSGTLLVVLLLLPVLAGAFENDSAARQGKCTTNWLYAGGMGVATPYFPKNVEQKERIARAFQTQKVAEQAEAVGAGWFLLSLHHQSWIMMAPNNTFDEILGNGDYTVEKDVPLELHRHLEPKGIKLMLYVNLRLDPKSAVDPVVREAMGGWPPNDRLIENIAAIYREFSVRYGDRVTGWWIDGAHLGDYRNAPERERWFGQIATALRAGNPSALVAFNPGVVVQRYSYSEDFTAGESEELVVFPTGRWEKGDQWHVLTFLGPWWGSGGTRFSTRELGEYVTRVTEKGGAVTLSVGTRGVDLECRAKKCSVRTQRDTGHRGYIDPAQVEQLKAVREYVKAPVVSELSNCTN